MKRTTIHSLAACTGMLALILRPDLASQGAAAGVQLCIKSVIPALFPFFFLNNVMTGALMGQQFGFLRWFGRMLGIPSGSETILISGFLGGYPSGAQAVGQVYKAGFLSWETANRLLTFCNNTGPSFLFGVLGAVFPRQSTLFSIWGIQLISAITVAMLVPKAEGRPVPMEASPKTASRCLLSALQAMAIVCGWVILFRVFIAFADAFCFPVLPSWLRVLVLGFLELTNGCFELLLIDDIRLRFLVCNGLLSFGGLCVFLQTAAVAEGLSMKSYLIGKLLQSILSVLLSLGFLYSSARYGIAGLIVFLIIYKKIRKPYSNSKILPV